MPTRLIQNLQTLLDDDVEKSRHAAKLKFMVLCTLGISVLLGAAYIATSTIPGSTLVHFCLFYLGLLLILALLHLGLDRLAGFLFVLHVWVSLTLVAAFIHGGLTSPAIDAYILIVFVAGLLLGERSGLVFAATCILALAALYAAGEGGYLPAALIPVTPLRRLIFQIATLILAAALFHSVSWAINEALKRAQRHERKLVDKNRELEEIRASLEERVSQRTQEILQQKQFFQALVENSPLAFVCLDLDHKIISTNRAFEKLFGYSNAEAIGEELDSLITIPTNRAEANTYTHQVLNGESINTRAQRFRKDGSLVWVEVNAVPVLVGDRQVGVLAFYIDISEERQAENALRAAKERAEQLYRVVPSAIFTVDRNRVITTFNNIAAEITGYSPQEVIGRECTIFAQGSCLSACGLLSDRIEKPIVGAECIIRTKKGETLTIVKNVDALRDEAGEVQGGIESFVDITQRKNTEEYLQHLATHDSLTILPNRSLFYERLRNALQAVQESGKPLAVLYLDLDGFKSVNDSFGHALGDRLIQSVAARLAGCMRKNDTVARLGGDEFACLFENIHRSEDAAVIAKKILQVISEPFQLGNEKIFITGSIGISLYPQDGEDVDRLVKNADAAMYRVKDRGKNHYEFFSIDPQDQKAVQ